MKVFPGTYCSSSAPGYPRALALLSVAFFSSAPGWPWDGYSTKSKKNTWASLYFWAGPEMNQSTCGLWVALLDAALREACVKHRVGYLWEERQRTRAGRGPDAGRTIEVKA
eukprot:gene23839-biopygen17861